MSIKGYKDANGNIQKYDINSLDVPFTAEVGQHYFLIKNSETEAQWG